MSGSEGELEVSEILGERSSSRRGLEYLVRWKDFGPSSDSWEPLRNLTHAALAIADFHRKTSSQQKKKKSSRSRSRSRSRGRSSSRSPARGKKKASPSRKSTTSKTTTTTTTKSTPTREETKTETLTQSPGRLTRTTETVKRSVLTPATQRSTYISQTAEVKTTSTSSEPAKPAQSSGGCWLRACCAPFNKMKQCCTGVVNSDYPAIVVFATIAVILLTFLLERNVDFEKVWGAIVAFFIGIREWLTKLVSK